MTLMSIGFWDVLLIVMVSLQATALAYAREPRMKAFIMSFPIPSTFATLALARRPAASNMLGLVLLLIYTHGVRILHRRFRVPIVPAIALGAAGYCALGAAIAPFLPDTDLNFWLATAGTLSLSAVLFLTLPYCTEPGHRSELPLYIKLPLVALVILAIVAIKNALQGFMALFPMVGVIAAYESRHSLWTLGRQIPLIMLTIGPLIVTSRITEPYVGLGASLALGWVVYLALFVPLTRWQWARSSSQASEVALSGRQA